MSAPDNTIYLDQSALVRQYDIAIPMELKFDVAAIEIRSKKTLSPQLITKICNIAVEAAIYSHIGFRGNTERSAALMREFAVLDQDQTTFTVFAHSSGGRGKNIEYPQSFSLRV